MNGYFDSAEFKSMESEKKDNPLGRSGYNFSDEQIEEIKTSVAEGRIKGAQERILHALDAAELGVGQHTQYEVPITFYLKYCSFEIYPISRRVCTAYKEGFFTWANRETNEDNIQEANSQGYSGEDAVWKSLVEHEYLHSLISELLYDHPSLVLETESGRAFHPSWLRYQEESVVIGIQFLLHHRWLRDESKIEIWDETKDQVNFSVMKSEYCDSVSCLLDDCQDAIANLWSQIEKDSK